MRRSVLVLVLAFLLPLATSNSSVGATVEPAAAPAAAAPAAARRDPVRLISDASWDLGDEWRSGTKRDARVRHGELVLSGTDLSRRYRGIRYDVGRWTSAWTSPGFGAT